MKISFKDGGVIFFLTFAFLSSVSARGQEYRYEFTPGISFNAVYEDNIYLRSIDKIDDYIGVITPSIDLDLEAEKTELSLYYAPSFVFYKENSDYDTTRHSANLSLVQNLTQNMDFNLTNTYYKSEESIEYSEDVQGVRNTREPYWRNRVDANLQFFFGPENVITLGYGQNYLKNEDPAIDDGRIQIPYASLAYGFNERNSVELTYEYTKGDFWRDDQSVARSDYDGGSGTIRYNHSLNTQTSFFIHYILATRDFDRRQTEGYDVHEGVVGFEHAFSPETSFLLSGGYFSQDLNVSDGQDGFVYDVALSREYLRGRFTISGNGGWDEPYLESERRGFTKYYGANASVDYQLQENVNLNVGASYRLNKEGGEYFGEDTGAEQEWGLWRGNAEFTWAFLQYYSLSLSYRYAKRDDDEPLNDYTSNRVMLSLMASKLFRW